MLLSTINFLQNDFDDHNNVIYKTFCCVLTTSILCNINTVTHLYQCVYIDEKANNAVTVAILSRVHYRVGLHALPIRWELKSSPCPDRTSSVNPAGREWNEKDEQS